ncbi:MAG: hypothetical protein Q8K36_00790, partial [Alphaproteobacteria bacterium]|nr:hypothetical protein [Alphaproteobacteria bacterium]
PVEKFKAKYIASTIRAFVMLNHRSDDEYVDRLFKRFITNISSAGIQSFIDSLEGLAALGGKPNMDQIKAIKAQVAFYLLYFSVQNLLDVIDALGQLGVPLEDDFLDAFITAIRNKHDQFQSDEWHKTNPAIQWFGFSRSHALNGRGISLLRTIACRELLIEFPYLKADAFMQPLGVRVDFYDATTDTVILIDSPQDGISVAASRWQSLVYDKVLPRCGFKVVHIQHNGRIYDTVSRIRDILAPKAAKYS